SGPTASCQTTPPAAAATTPAPNHAARSVAAWPLPTRRRKRSLRRWIHRRGVMCMGRDYARSVTRTVTRSVTRRRKRVTFGGKSVTRGGNCVTRRRKRCYEREQGRCAPDGDIRVGAVEVALLAGEEWRYGRGEGWRCWRAMRAGQGAARDRAAGAG